MTPEIINSKKEKKKKRNPIVPVFLVREWRISCAFIAYF